MATSPADLVIAIPTFIGSLLSLLATTAAVVLHIVIPPKRHFRHTLIVNLLVADFINSLNNTISGALAIAKGHLNQNATVDHGCIANAWIGQFSVQAVDFNILAISIVVLCTVLNSQLIEQPSIKATGCVCVAVWVPGMITSNIGLGFKAYGDVSGNWCWVRPEYLGLRYALTHGWRIAIFFSTIAIYTYIYIHLKRAFGKFRVSDRSSATTSDHTCIDAGPESSDTQRILDSNSFAMSLELNDRTEQSQKPVDKAALDKVASWMVPPDCDQYGSRTKSTRFHSARKSSAAIRSESRIPAPPNLKKMLLLNGYPIAYIILWIPGMANRLVESLGTSPRWLEALQSSTQFIGLVNALTYGVSEQKRQVLQQRTKG